MDTLLLRFSGPMQSWGVQSRFSMRETGLEPSKSGVLGLICAAIGIPKEDEARLAQLAELRMGVRIDREGVLKVDYHTAKDVLKAAGGIKETEPSHRYYLAGAVFLVGLEGGDRLLLDHIQNACSHPVWPLFLGRKAFVPSELVWLEDGLRPDTSLEEALTTYPVLCKTAPPDGRLRLVCEDPSGSTVRPDQPLSYLNRRFASRWVKIQFIPIPEQTKEAI